MRMTLVTKNLADFTHGIYLVILSISNLLLFFQLLICCHFPEHYTSHNDSKFDDVSGVHISLEQIYPCQHSQKSRITKTF